MLSSYGCLVLIAMSLAWLSQDAWRDGMAAWHYCALRGAQDAQSSIWSSPCPYAVVLRLQRRREEALLEGILWQVTRRNRSLRNSLHHRTFNMPFFDMMRYGGNTAANRQESGPRNSLPIVCWDVKTGEQEPRFGGGTGDKDAGWRARYADMRNAAAEKVWSVAECGSLEWEAASRPVLRPAWPAP